MRLKVLGGVVALALAATAGSAIALVSAEPTDAMLDADLATVRSEIAAAEADATAYSGGLILAQIELRLQTLRTTEAMLDQKRRSWFRGIDLIYRVDGREHPPTTANDLATIEDELRTLSGEIARSEAEAARYSGGLIQVMTLATAATQRTSLALLRMRYLTAKHGIPLYIDADSPTGGAGTSSPTPGAVVADPDAL